TDFSEPAAAALPLAARIARSHGADLHALHALVLHAADAVEADKLFPRMEDAVVELDRWAESRMAAHLGEHDVGDLVVHEARERGFSVGAVILEYAEEHDIDLIVMGTHGRRGLQHLFMGSIAEDVVRRSSCPVITVRERPRLGDASWPARLVAPVDFSEASHLALAYVRELAAASGAKVDLVHVIEPVTVPDPYITGTAGFAFDVETVRSNVQDALEELAASVLGEAVPCEIHIDVGRPAAMIAAFAEERGADLVVMASHGRTGLQRALVGSVASGVIRRSSPPVMIVKPSGRQILPSPTSETT
ncbi:MAG: universal stress protein, partial [Candidatus Palauibacterales bacterium]|nr:universal stress protein [Candidatus Palauibacterales bacterium]